MTTDIHVLSAQMSLQAALAAEGDLLMIPAPAVRNEAIRRRHVLNSHMSGLNVDSQVAAHTDRERATASATVDEAATRCLDLEQQERDPSTIADRVERSLVEQRQRWVASALPQARALEAQAREALAVAEARAATARATLDARLKAISELVGQSVPSPAA